MKYFLFIFCMVLCSCLPFGDEAVPSSSSSEFEPCPSNSVELDPLILSCPPDDIALCPVLNLPDDWRHTTPEGGCPGTVKMSKEEVLFDAQGGVRCVTIDRPLGVYYDENSWLTSTKVADRVVRIWVDKNETGKERKLNIGVRALYCVGGFSVTQSAE